MPCTSRSAVVLENLNKAKSARDLIKQSMICLPLMGAL